MRRHQRWEDGAEVQEGGQREEEEVQTTAVFREEHRDLFVISTDTEGVFFYQTTG